MKVMAMIGSAVMAAGMLAGCGNSGAAATTAAPATTAEQTTEAKAEETTKEKDYGVRINESTITTERYEETPVIETAKNITVITGEEIEKKGYRNVEDALKVVPGLFLTD